MPQKLPEKTIGEINKLYKEGLNPKEISNQIGVYYATVYGRTRRIEKLKQKGFKSYPKYQKHLVKQKVSEYREHLIKKDNKILKIKN